MDKDGVIVEKPANLEEQQAFMIKFSNSYHDVISWMFVSFNKDGVELTKEHQETSRVYFSEIPEKSIEMYGKCVP